MTIWHQRVSFTQTDKGAIPLPPAISDWASWWWTLLLVSSGSCSDVFPSSAIVVVITICVNIIVGGIMSHVYLWHNFVEGRHLTPDSGPHHQFYMTRRIYQAVSLTATTFLLLIMDSILWLATHTCIISYINNKLFVKKNSNKVMQRMNRVREERE